MELTPIQKELVEAPMRLHQHGHNQADLEAQARKQKMVVEAIEGVSIAQYVSEGHSAAVASKLVKNDPAYKEATEKLIDIEMRAQKKKIDYRALEAKIENYRTVESSLRAQMNLK